MKQPVHQQGFLIITAIFIILLVGVIGALLARSFVSLTDAMTFFHSGNRAFFLAEAGLERGVASQLSRSFSQRIACSGLSGSSDVTTVSLGSGEFSVGQSSNSPQYPEPPVSLSSTITSSATSLTADATVPTGSSTSYSPAGRIMIDREAIDYTEISGSLFIGLTRGVDGTSASSHPSGASIGQFQCNLIATGGVPELGASSSNGKRQVTQGVQLQEGWAVGIATTTQLTFTRWNRPTEVQWNAALQTDTVTNLNSVSMLNYAAGWAVGNTIAGPDFTIYGWNPSTSVWDKQATSTIAVSDLVKNLFGVSAVSSDQVWAVGVRGAVGNKQRFTILLWNGSVWCPLDPGGTCDGFKIPADKKKNGDLNAVHVIDTTGDGAGDRGFAVGEQTKERILSFDGSSWQDNQTLPGSVKKPLNDVFVVSPTEAWTVGVKGTILKTDPSGGTGIWSSVPSPVAQNFNGIYMLDTDGDGAADVGWIVGAKGNILRWDGSTWTSQTSPTTDELFSVSAFSPNDAWAVGNKSGTALHWDGVNWSIVSSGVVVDLNDIDLVGSTKKRGTPSGPNRKPQSSFWKEVFKNLS